MHYTVLSQNVAETQQLGREIGQALQGGEVIELRSDVGGGKTALTKGIAAGMGSRDAVQSPSFTISRVYRGHRQLELHHFDFYRLDEPGLMSAELAEVLDDPQAVTVIEWSDIVAHVLPAERIEIVIVATGETTRRLEVEVPAKQEAMQQVLVKLSQQYGEKR